MADIFLSYSREDHDRAAEIAQALNAAGYQVFWDVEIPPGKSWADILEEKLAICKAAVVLWSRVSTASKWVREEARLAHDRGKLIPVQIDDSAPPFGFGEIQAADLKHWRGNTADPHWRIFLNAVSAAVARPPGTAAASAPPPQPIARPSAFAAVPRPSIGKLLEPASRGYLFAGIGLFALVAAIALRFIPIGPSTPAPPEPPPASTSTEPTTDTPTTTTSAPETPPSPSPPPASPTTEGETFSSGVTREEIARYLTSLGYSAKATTDANNNDVVKSAVDGVTFNVYFYNCKLERCGEIQFSAGWTMHTMPSADTLNAWNRQKRFARAYTNSEAKGLFIEMDLNLRETTSNEQIDEYLRFWKILLADFKKQFSL